MPGLLASAAALGAGKRLGGSPEAPAGGIFWPDYPHTELLEHFLLNILQVVHVDFRWRRPATIWRCRTSTYSRVMKNTCDMPQLLQALQDVGPYQQLFGAYSNPPRVSRPYDDSKFSKSAEKLCLHCLAALPPIRLTKKHQNRYLITTCLECLQLRLPNSADLRRKLGRIFSEVGLRSVEWMHQIFFDCKICGQSSVDM